MEKELYQIGTGGLFIILVLREIFGFLKVRKLDGSSTKAVCSYDREKFNDVYRTIKDLYKLHDIRDRDGVPVWYVRQSLEESIHKLADNIETQTRVMQAMLNSINDNKVELANIKHDLKSIKEKAN